jgi:hypothetical protein
MDASLVVGMALLAVLLPCVYVLAIGPAILLRTNGVLSSQAFETIFWPLFYLASEYDWARDALNSYVRLWPGSCWRF